ncbi:MAG: hypothetical protein ACD_75C02342G0001 [uncultured bacterium]|nr:MAG: hypothetical protein ACD_75C02342G0001 [uncultured bacterium]
MIMIQHASRGKYQRVFIIRSFRRRRVFNRVKKPLSADKRILVEHSCPGVVAGWAGPGNCLFFYFCIGDTGINGGEAVYLLHDFTRVVVIHRVAKAGGEIGDDFPVCPGVARRGDGLADELNQSLRACESAVLLGKTGGREDHIGGAGRFGHENILYDEEIESLESRFHM